MKAFQTRLADGRIFYVAAYTKADIPCLLEAEGVERHAIRSARPVKVELPEVSEPTVFDIEA